MGQAMGRKRDFAREMTEHERNPANSFLFRLQGEKQTVGAGFFKKSAERPKIRIKREKCTFTNGTASEQPCGHASIQMNGGKGISRLPPPIVHKK